MRAAVGLFGDRYDSSIVEEAVKTSRGQEPTAEDLGELVSGAAGCDEDGAALLAFADDVEEKAAWFGHWSQTFGHRTVSTS